RLRGRLPRPRPERTETRDPRPSNALDPGFHAVRVPRPASPHAAAAPAPRPRRQAGVAKFALPVRRSESDSVREAGTELRDLLCPANRKLAPRSHAGGYGIRRPAI